MPMLTVQIGNPGNVGVMSCVARGAFVIFVIVAIILLTYCQYALDTCNVLVWQLIMTLVYPLSSGFCSLCILSLISSKTSYAIKSWFENTSCYSIPIKMCNVQWVWHIFCVSLHLIWFFFRCCERQYRPTSHKKYQLLSLKCLIRVFPL